MPQSPREVATEFYTAYKAGIDAVGHGPDFVEDLRNAIVLLLESEREECARIAERNKPNANLRGDHKSYDLMGSIAVSIRERNVRI